MPTARELVLPAAAVFAAGVLAAKVFYRRHYPPTFSWHSAHTLPSGIRVQLRSGNSADIGALYKQIRALAELHDELDDLLTTEADIRSAFEDGGFHVLLVELDGEVVGSAITQDSYRTWTGPSLYLQDLIVEETHRGKGIGTLVMRALAAIAIRRGCNQLFWESHAGNSKANAFYADVIGGETSTGEHQIVTWKLMGTNKLASCAERAYLTG